MNYATVRPTCPSWSSLPVAKSAGGRVDEKSAAIFHEAISLKTESARRDGTGTPVGGKESTVLVDVATHHNGDVALPAETAAKLHESQSNAQLQIKLPDRHQQVRAASVHSVEAAVQDALPSNKRISGTNGFNEVGRCLVQGHGSAGCLCHREF